MHRLPHVTPEMLLLKYAQMSTNSDLSHKERSDPVPNPKRSPLSDRQTSTLTQKIMLWISHFTD
jgi:hypothetical protein